MAAQKGRKCPNCGSELSFNPENGTLTCPNCHSCVDMGEASTEQIVERGLEQFLAETENLDEETERLVAHCPNCGAEVRFADNVVAGFCSYCRTPISAASASTRSIRPQGLIPFAITVKQAGEAFSKWLSGLWFLPNDAKKLGLASPPVGCYRPCWTFDFNTETSYDGYRGDYYYVTVTHRENGKTVTRQERRTRWTPVSGWVQDAFDDVTVHASSVQPIALQEGLGPWRLPEAVDYDSDKTRGFSEESYDVRISDGLNCAKEKAKDTIQDSIRRDIGGDEQRIDSFEVTYSDFTFKLLLLPFWESMYTYRKKMYRYLVNGQTGKAHGERPWSAVKIAFAVLLGLIAVGMLLLLIANS